jgi:hypothetical protein
MKKYLVVCLWMPTMAMAQSKADIVKFEIIKSTVDFYATDTAFKGSLKQASNCPTGDYNCLELFCKNNGLTGVWSRVSDWRKATINTKASVIAFKDSVVKDVTTKVHRTNLPSHADYRKELDDLIAGYKEDVATAASVAAPKANDTTNNATQGSTVVATEAPSTSAGWLPWAALIAGLGGLGLGLLAFLRKPKAQAGQVEMATAAELEQVKRNLATLTAQLNQKADAATIQALETKLGTVEGLAKKAGQQAAATNTAKEEVRSNKAAAPAPTAATKLYAKLPDIDNGFSNNILKTEQLGEQAYELTVGESSGSYTISSDRDAQSYAVNDFNYILARGCTLNNQPFTNCRVETVQPGTLSKGKDGWMIERKAVVEFR